VLTRFVKNNFPADASRHRQQRGLWVCSFRILEWVMASRVHPDSTAPKADCKSGLASRIQKIGAGMPTANRRSNQYLKSPEALYQELTIMMGRAMVGAPWHASVDGKGTIAARLRR
jgi:hypothetical protein